MGKASIEDFTAWRELGAMLADWCEDLGRTAGLNATDYFTEDCAYEVADKVHRGHDAVRAFYASYRALVATQQPDGIRTTRIVFSNLRLAREQDDRAMIAFTLINFSQPGSPPLADATLPAIVADARAHCRRGTDGAWRFAEFSGGPIFVRRDPLIEKTDIGLQDRL